MTEALNNPAKRTYVRREANTGEMPIAQKDDINLDADIQRGESLVMVAAESELNEVHQAALAFMEEPLTIRIEENSRSDFPETHVPVAVNGRGAEVFMNGQWVPMTWLPIGQPIITKRKYVEVLARSKQDAIRTVHDDANVERPRNSISRSSKVSYPLSIIRDDNPKGHEWLSRIIMGH